MADRRQIADVVFPLGGLSETFSFTDQPPSTSRDERNMRSFDPHTGRMRGSQRAGLALHTGSSPANNFDKIADLAYVQREVNPYDWSVASTPDVLGQQTFEKVNGLSSCIDMRRDLFGSYWALCEGGEVLQINGDGYVYKRHKVSVDESTPLKARRIAVDDFGNFFVSSGQEPTHAVAQNDEAWVKCYELLEDQTYKLAWTLKPGFHVLDMAIYGADLFLWGVYYDEDHHNKTKLRLRRYVEYGFAEAPTVDTESSYDRNWESDARGFGEETTTPAVFSGGSNGWSTSGSRIYVVGELHALDNGDMLVCFSGWKLSASQHVAIWGGFGRLRPISLSAETAQHWTLSATSTRMGVGIMRGPELDDGSASIWTYGSSGSAAGVKLWKDTGTAAVSAVGDIGFGTNSTGWAIRSGDPGGGATDPGHWHTRATYDEDGVAYIPFHAQDDAGGTIATPLPGDYDGYGLLVFKVNSDETDIEEVTKYASNDLGIGTIGNRTVQVPLVYPDYQGATINLSNIAVIGGDQTDQSGKTNSCAVSEIVTAAIDDTLNLREISTIAAAGGKFYKYSTTGFTVINDPDAAAIGYETTTNYVQSATIRGQVFFADGVDYYAYDPAKNTITRMQAEGVGAVPRRCRLITAWRNRLVVARSDETPGAWHMSRSGDPYDWNPFPSVPDTSQPHSGTTSRAGQCPDSINSLVPFTDDTMWFGCDRSIWQMSGDPANDAVFDLVSDEIGMSFGNPWCKDDTGALWFFGSKGGLYTTYETQISRGRQLLRDVSQGAVRKRFQNIDLTRYYVRLAYNFIDDGVHIFVCPFGNPGTVVDHYFYDKRTQSFHVDRFGSRQTDLIQPTAVQVVDGDSPTDRAIMIGGEDGRVRRWGKDANGQIPMQDEGDGTNDKPIDSYVLIGPLAPVRDVSSAAVSEFTAILAPTHHGCDYEFFATDTPDNLGRADYQGQLHAGRNATQLPRVSGDSIYLRLRNGRADQTWAFEKANVALSYGGGIRR
ncbi:hypothetical protein [Limnobacter sp.]|uniref:hypothetical protein n=1 Tax=Limnobacter sp. TaxID=2003368 RepID=UPI0025C1AF84|nr:hypothetical protein [Limnobacter sp.]